MSIPVSVSNGKAVSTPGYDRPGKLKDDDKPGASVKSDTSSNKVKDVDTPASAVAKSRANLNSAIVQTTMNVALNTGNEPLALLLKTAINGINEELKPSMGDDAIQNAAANQDNSPEATASRIVSLSTGFYDAYRTQNKLEDNAETREQFVGVIRGGFEKGFKDAQNVLQGLKVLNGDVATGIDRTYELVMKGFDEFSTIAQSQPGSKTALPDPV